ncbi:hypothetical protein J437_LFUL012193 [Ladona fulva]|uniref:G-protein coupled receptors family 1 profile domain-containing protein n=1 Tax=Ladona fulva TaxID=123851 RepID=A0A8K0P8P8_LADFU|nr:hypothetical protein J437_LFUL012193 [Ladona fulva]
MLLENQSSEQNEGERCPNEPRNGLVGKRLPRWTCVSRGDAISVKAKWMLHFRCISQFLRTWLLLSSIFLTPLHHDFVPDITKDYIPLQVAICAGILLDLVAFGANAAILWVVLGNKNLRKAPTSVFLLNLCISDIFVSLFLIPIAITILFSAFQEDGIYVPTYLCEPVSFINSLLVYSGVWAAAAISVDRRFSIVAPMAHSAFMTTRRALMATGMVWVTAAGFALLPHIFPTESPKNLFNYTSTAVILISSSISLHSNYTSNVSTTATNSTFFAYNSSASVLAETTDDCSAWKTCALMFTLDWSNSSHVFAVVIGCYLIPALLMISMYVSIFKVARKAGLQAQKASTMSIPTISGEVEAKAEIPEEIEIGSELKSATVERQGETNRNCILRHLIWSERQIVGDPPYHSSMENSEEFTCPQCSSRSTSRLYASLSDASATRSISAGGKARRTLLLIMGLSLASWTPYYVVHAYCACTNDCWKDVPLLVSTLLHRVRRRLALVCIFCPQPYLVRTAQQACERASPHQFRENESPQQTIEIAVPEQTSFAFIFAEAFIRRRVKLKGKIQQDLDIEELPNGYNKETDLGKFKFEGGLSYIIVN